MSIFNFAGGKNSVLLYLSFADKLPGVSCILEYRTVQSGLHRGAPGSSVVDLEQDTFILA